VFTDYNFSLALENFWKSLQMMWQGMLGIFVVLGVLALVVLLLSKIPQREKEEK